jgi:hypothetical protein
MDRHELNDDHHRQALRMDQTTATPDDRLRSISCSDNIEHVSVNGMEPANGATQ